MSVLVEGGGGENDCLVENFEREVVKCCVFGGGEGGGEVTRPDYSFLSRLRCSKNQVIGGEKPAKLPDYSAHNSDFRLFSMPILPYFF